MPTTASGCTPAARDVRHTPRRKALARAPGLSIFSTCFRAQLTVRARLRVGVRARAAASRHRGSRVRPPTASQVRVGFGFRRSPQRARAQSVAGAGRSAWSRVAGTTALGVARRVERSHCRRWPPTRGAPCAAEPPPGPPLRAQSDRWPRLPPPRRLAGARAGAVRSGGRAAAASARAVLDGTSRRACLTCEHFHRSQTGCLALGKCLSLVVGPHRRHPSTVLIGPVRNEP